MYNQKDFKEIAKIIKEKLWIDEKQLNVFVNALMDYFERKDKENKKKYGKNPYGMNKKGFDLWWKFHNFNRKQFKEWCGS